jgi:tRNA A22 N-methylase
MTTMSRRSSLLALAATFLAGPALAQKKGKERFPKIREALENMKEAKAELEKAAKVFGGHRKKAIDALDSAISELQQALDFAEGKKQ